MVRADNRAASSVLRLNLSIKTQSKHRRLVEENHAIRNDVAAYHASIHVSHQAQLRSAVARSKHQYVHSANPSGRAGRFLTRASASSESMIRSYRHRQIQRLGAFLCLAALVVGGVFAPTAHFGYMLAKESGPFPHDSVPHDGSHETVNHAGHTQHLRHASQPAFAADVPAHAMCAFADLLGSLSSGLNVCSAEPDAPVLAGRTAPTAPRNERARYVDETCAPRGPPVVLG